MENKKTNLEKLQMSKKEMLFWRVAIILSLVWCAYWSYVKLTK